MPLKNVENVKQMEYEKLFTLLHGLSVQQKKNLTVFIKGSEDTLTFLLYRRMKKSKNTDKASKEKVKGEEFSNSHQFHKYRMFVAEWIIKSILHHKEPSFSVESYIKTAFLYEADGLAKRTLINEMRRLQEKEDHKSIKLLHDLVAELEVFHSISVVLPQDLYPSQIVNRCLEKQLELFEFEMELKAVAHKSDQIRKEVAKRIETGLCNSFESVTNKCLAKKIQMTTSYYNGEMESALQFGKELVKSFWNGKGELGPIWSSKSAWIMRQYRFVIILCLLADRRNDAVHYSLELSRVIPSSPSEKNKALKSQILIGSSVAVFYADLLLAEQSLVQLDGHFKEFTTFELCKVYYNLGMAFFYNDQFEKAVRCFQKARNEVTVNFDFLRWEPQLLLALCHFELGNIKAADSHLGSAKREAMQSDFNYPLHTVKLIEKFIESDFKGREFSLLFSNSLQSIENILSDPEEKRISNWFSIVVWAKSKLESVPAKDVYLQHSSNRSLKERILSLSLG